MTVKRPIVLVCVPVDCTSIQTWSQIFSIRYCFCFFENEYTRSHRINVFRMHEQRRFSGTSGQVCFACCRIHRIHSPIISIVVTYRCARCAITFKPYLFVFCFRQDPGIGNLITFSQFFLIALQGFIFTAKCGTKKPSISVKYVTAYLHCLYEVYI